MPIAPRADRSQRPPTSSALEKMRQICRGIIASREGLLGVALISLVDSQPVAVASNPDFMYLDRLLDVSRTGAAMFRGASIKAAEHAAEITGRQPEGPVVRSIQVETETSIAVNRLLDEHDDHMFLLIAQKSVPIGMTLMTTKQACHELEPLLAQHLASVAAQAAQATQ